MSKQKDMELTKEQQEAAAALVRAYAEANWDFEMSGLQGKLFVRFLTEKVGPMYYNLGVGDAMRYLNERVEDLYALMKEEGRTDSR